LRGRFKLPAQSGKIENVIGANTSVSGTLKSDGNIRVEGVVQGVIETTGNVIVGPSARVLAEINAQVVQVWGAVRGNITAASQLEILPNGRVWGDVLVGALHIDEGGVFRGQCTMLSETPRPLMLARGEDLKLDEPPQAPEVLEEPEVKETA